MFSSKKSTPQEVIAALRKTPVTASDSLFSRRRQTVEIRGETIAFPLEEKSTTHPEFVQLIKTAQEDIFKRIENDAGHTGTQWPDKETRRREKFYKRNKKLHLTLFGVTLPCLVDEFEAIRQSRYDNYIKEVRAMLTNLLNQEIAICGKATACRLNPDGHIVVCIEMHPQNNIPACRKKLEALFGKRHYQYDSPDKERLLHAVIGVVDYTRLSPATQTWFDERLARLEQDLKQAGAIPLLDLEWIVYDKRTVSENSRLSVTTLTRERPAFP